MMMTPNPNDANFNDLFVSENGQDLEAVLMDQLRAVRCDTLKPFSAPSPNRGGLDPHKYARWCAATLRYLEREGRVMSVRCTRYRLYGDEGARGLYGRKYVVTFIP